MLIAKEKNLKNNALTMHIKAKALCTIKNSYIVVTEIKCSIYDKVTNFIVLKFWAISYSLLWIPSKITLSSDSNV